MNRVLLVDDEATVMRALGRVLRSADFEVTAVTEATAALELLRSHEYDVIVSDERMPVMTGVEFLEICSREFPTTTRILLTGFADPNTAAEAINRAEIFRLLWKPWTNDEVVAIVRQAAWKTVLGRELSARTETPATPPPFLRLVGD